MSYKCPNCQNEIPKGTSFCLHCFSAITENNPPQPKTSGRKKTGAYLISAFAVLIVALAVALITIPKQQDKNTAPLTEKSVSETTSAIQTKADTTTQLTTKQTTVLKAVESTTQTTQTTTLTTSQTTENTVNTTTKPKTTKAASTKIIIKDGKLADYPKSVKKSSYTIPYSVKSIGKNAFNGNQYLKTLKFSKREDLSCDWQNLFANLPNLERIYIYAGTSVDTEGMQYFRGEIIYYYD